MTDFWITKETIDLNTCIQNVIRPEAGAISTFIGVAREFTKGKQTLHLEYEAYVPMAVKQLKKINDEIQRKWPETRVSIGHRIGRLEISDVAVAIAVSSPHRAAAFEASRYAIERIKEIVPIWKKEFWSDGTQWIGDQKEHTSYQKENSNQEVKR